MKRLILCLLAVFCVFFAGSGAQAQLPLPDLNIQQNYENGQKKMEIKTEDGKYIIREYGPDGTLTKETIESKDELMKKRQEEEARKAALKAQAAANSVPQEPQIREYLKGVTLTPAITCTRMLCTPMPQPGPNCRPCNRCSHSGRWHAAYSGMHIEAVSLSGPFPLCEGTTNECDSCQFKIKADGYIVDYPGSRFPKFHAETWSIAEEGR